MQTDSGDEWRRLAEEYRARSDEELRELAADFSDLTETAQQALRQEMRSRGLGDPGAPEAPPLTNARPVPVTAHIEPDPDPEQLASSHGPFRRTPELVPDAPADADDEGPHDYTWKTVLCDCETNEQALGLSVALRRAGLDSWCQTSREFGRRYAQVLVAADQLEQARAIASRPIPQQVTNEANEIISEFVEPKCPKCGSDDVVLDGVDSENHWRCEQCDAKWSDPEAAGGQNTAKPGNATP